MAAAIDTWKTASAMHCILLNLLILSPASSCSLPLSFTSHFSLLFSASLVQLIITTPSRYRPCTHGRRNPVLSLPSSVSKTKTTRQTALSQGHLSSPSLQCNM
ncbi:hypothetical protein GGI42DRAFT_162492 [Trichoderma sp. SZMC 28013]